MSTEVTSQCTDCKAVLPTDAKHCLVYGYLALMAPGVFFGAIFLRAVGLLTLVCHVFLGARYWFSVPFRGIVLATSLYAVALAIGRA